LGGEPMEDVLGISKMPICDIENWAKKTIPETDEELSTLLLMMRAQLKFQFQML